MTKLAPALDAAITYAAHGLRSFPLKARSKEPATSHGFKDATLDGGVLHRRFGAAGVDANVGIATGDGIIVLDLDGPEAGAWLDANNHEGRIIPETWAASTGRGTHLYLKVDRKVATRPGLVPKVDVKGEGGYVVAPPSIHPDGSAYRWIVGGLGEREGRKAIAPAPTWLLALLDEPRAATRQDMSAGAAFPEGGRNSGLAAEAGRLRRRGLSQPAIEAELREINRARCQPPLEDDEVLNIARSVSRYAPDPVAVADDKLDAKVRGKGPVPTDVERKVARAEPPEDNDSATSSPGPGGDRSEDERTGWERVDLGPAVRGEILSFPPRHLPRADGVCLLYPGKLHWISGEPEGLKSWLAMIAVADALAEGASACYVDFEGDPLTIVERLRQLGVSDDALQARLSYHRPEVPMSSTFVARLLRGADALTPSVSVIDGVNAAMGASNLDSNHSTDFHRWWTQLGHRLQLLTTGPTIAVDHVVKNPENRGQYAAGTGQKLAAVDVHIGTHVFERFGRGMTGRAKLLLHKDRPGALRPRAMGFQLGTLVLASNAQTGDVRFNIEPARGEGDPDSPENRPTGYMERVSKSLEGMIVGKKQSEVKAELGGKQEYVIAAINALVAGGYVQKEASGHTAILRSVNRYRESEDSRRTSAVLRAAGTSSFPIAAGGDLLTVPNRSRDSGTVGQGVANRSPLTGEQLRSGSEDPLTVPLFPTVPGVGERLELCAVCGDVNWHKRRGRWMCGSCGEYAAA